MASPNGDELDSLPDVKSPKPFPNDPSNHDYGKYYVHGVIVSVVSERVEYYSDNGELVTESLKDFTRRSILGQYDSLDHFLRAWSSERKKKAIVDALEEHGAFIEELRAESGQQDLSDFDLICHIAYDQKPLTRKERANNVRKKGYLYEYAGLARDVLETLLDKYATSNLVDLDDARVLKLPEFRKYGSPMKIVKAFGGKEKFVYAAQSIEDALYSA